MEAKQVQAAPEKAPWNVAVTRLTQQQNQTMLHLFRTAYCIVKHTFSISVLLQKLNGLDLGTAYQNRMAASVFIASIAKVQLQSIVDCLMAQLTREQLNRRSCTLECW